MLMFSKLKLLCTVNKSRVKVRLHRIKSSRRNLPAEECITGSDAAGRAKSVSSEKQIEYNLSRNTELEGDSGQEEQARVQCLMS